MRHFFSRRALIAVAALFGAVWPVRAADLPAPDVEHFEKRVRPVLAERCWGCHGSDLAESGLRLDSLAAMRAGGTRGPAVVPGDPKTSLLILAVNHADQLHMPPKSKIPQREIDELTEWVKRGAVWPNDAPPPIAATKKSRTISEDDRQFWSFRPVVRPPLPRANDAAWIRRPLDAFVLNRLEQAGLTPAPAADKRSLIRRATLDLLGLPPTPEEVAEFLAADRPDALERLVDRLLASPHYGERWGRHWLDLARYGDSNGLDENLAFANAFRYRDYVIDAFNADLPYDEFLAEQIAGDLMPSDDPATHRRRIAATGFLALGAKMLAEDDPVKMEMDIIDEQVDTLGRAVLGMTLGCARCHDHKFDPILASDYYGLAGIFKSTKTMENFTVVARWQERPLGTPSELRERDARLAVVNGIRSQADAAIAAERDRLLIDVRRQTETYVLAAYREERLSDRPAAFARAPEGNLSRLAGARVIEAEAFDRGNVQKDFGSYGREIGVLVNRGETPNFVEYDVEIAEPGLYQLDLRYAAAGARPCRLSLNGTVVKKDAAGRVTGSWTPETQTWFFEGVYRFAKGKNVVRLEHPQFFPHIDRLLLIPATDERFPANLSAEIDAVPLIPDVVTRWRTLLAKADSPFAAWRHAASGRRWPEFNRNADPLSPRLLAGPAPATIRELAARYASLLAVPPAQPDEALAEVEKALRADSGPWSPTAIPESSLDAMVKERLAELRRRQAEAAAQVPPLEEAMAVSEGTPQDLRIHLRGSHVTLGEPTARQFPVVFNPGSDPPIGERESGRLQLARWLADPAHPLTARVIVNRVWQHHFGEGLVRSPDNFGRLGERPTHPELLDWLAAELRGSGVGGQGPEIRGPKQDVDAGGSTAIPDSSPEPRPPTSDPLPWSLKRLHRAILLSAAWRQGAAWNARASEVDPENRLLWRMPRRRLEAEPLRDSLLFVGGTLDETFGGTLLPTKNRQYVTSTANVNPEIYVSHRRTIYLPVVRSAVHDFLVAFDFGDPSVMQGRRDRTTVAPQALYLMNSPLVSEQAKRLAGRLIEHPGTDADRIALAFEILFARPATAPESERGTAFLTRYAASFDDGEGDAARRAHAWQALCRALLASNEFLYVN